MQDSDRESRINKVKISKTPNKLEWRQAVEKLGEKVKEQRDQEYLKARQQLEDSGVLGVAIQLALDAATNPSGTVRLDRVRLEAGLTKDNNPAVVLRINPELVGTKTGVFVGWASQGVRIDLDPKLAICRVSELSSGAQQWEEKKKFVTIRENMDQEQQLLTMAKLQQGIGEVLSHSPRKFLAIKTHSRCQSDLHRNSCRYHYHLEVRIKRTHPKIKKIPICLNNN